MIRILIQSNDNLRISQKTISAKNYWTRCQIIWTITDYPDNYGQLKINDSLNCNLIISTKARFNHSIFISQIMTIHKSKLSYTQRYHKLISTSYLIFQDCHSEQPPQTTQVSSVLELTLLTSEVIFVTIFWMAIMNLGTNIEDKNIS
ncbi:Hypothetical_protein [Hexamita inflata]|uniref:Hypothetical_protein n=1 Tax=Hexamita inflata TaxID=28002 RepID=A0AA86USZ7_9EUKA|nr:Hypothetical protein HINF_LOCUS58095 [Hexamita inflata]